jgi:hypothetical protein
MTTLSRVDREALDRALRIARAESAEEAAHIDRLMAARGWQWAAESAVYHLQCKALRLRPWQPPPCWIRDLEGDLAAGDDGISGRYRAALLTQRLLRAGLSRFEPDPVAALERAESTRRDERVEGGDVRGPERQLTT